MSSRNSLFRGSSGPASGGTTTGTIFPGGQSQITKNKTASGTGVNHMSINLVESPGELKYSYNISGNLSTSTSKIQQLLSGHAGSEPTTAHLRVNITGLSKLKNAISSSLTNAISSATGVPSQFINGHQQGSLVSGYAFDTSIPLSLRATIGGSAGRFISPFANTVTEVGHSPVTGSKDITFTPIKIPAPKGFDLRRHISGVPMPKLKFTVAPVNLVESALGNKASVQFELDPGLFVEKINLGSFNCTSIFNNADSKITSVESDVTSFSHRVSGIKKQINSIKNKVLSEANANSLSSISKKDILNLQKSQFQGDQTVINEAQSLRSDLQNLRGSVSNLKSNTVDNIHYPRCKSGFTDRISSMNNVLDNAKSEISTIENDIPELKKVISSVGSINCSQAYSDISSSLDSVKSKIGLPTSGSVLSQNIPSRITNNQITSAISDLNNTVNKINQIPSSSPCSNKFMSEVSSIRQKVSQFNTGQTSVLGCSKLSSNMRSRISSFVSAAKTFQSTSINNRSQSKRQKLISEGTSLVNDIQSLGNVSQSCKQQKLSQIHNSLQIVKSSGVKPSAPKPCKDQYPNISSNISTYEARIQNLSPPIHQSEFNSIAKSGDQIISQIKNTVPQNSNCRQQLISEINSYTQRAGRLEQNVRVTVQQGNKGQAGKSNQILEQLLKSIQQMQRGG